MQCISYFTLQIHPESPSPVELPEESLLSNPLPLLQLLHHSPASSPSSEEERWRWSCSVILIPLLRLGRSLACYLDLDNFHCKVKIIILCVTVYVTHLLLALPGLAAISLSAPPVRPAYSFSCQELKARF